MQMQRLTRLTNYTNKTLVNHSHMVALYTVWYNWCCIHKILNVAPAMTAGLIDKLNKPESLVAA